VSNFLGGAEISARTEMLGLTNQLQNAEMQAQKAENTGGAKSADKVKKVAVEFESIFLGYMLKQMRKTVPDDPLFGNSTAKDIFYDMHYDNMAKEMAKAGGIGLATILYNQLSKMDGNTQK